ncbi:MULTISPECIES: acetylglutamate kinase [Helicobacter]|uniref:Acetylglutamate kinase n=3 Tax=Helicobacter typhlonius TaxID=76936 RepID=A0A099UG27_9HELI|nr:MULTISPECIES: acetylglutamate kinase [Helicobacter]TLD79403.1 acetylglutamate kinase [Helicobacter typhlonius]TLD86385.1 acetylglutamate kinase [Helicobacter sp. MIT 03-1616]CUU39508.1 Acetylglutamate kinase [Helicobacter typhlonius]HCD73300.1 acetylglutamate kinase [Helicobacter sp.]
MQKNTRVVKILLDSLPFIRIFRGKIIVIKYGGAAQSSPELKEKFALDIVIMYMLGLKPVIIHGGGKRINEVLDTMGIQSSFKDGYRVTCADSMRVVEMVLSGEINKELTAFLNFHGAKAVGISGKDAHLLQAVAKDDGALGYTGDITQVNPEFLLQVIDNSFVPVIAPIATGEGAGHLGYNINADLAACHIAKALKAEKVIFLSDIAGVLDANKELISTLTPKSIRALEKEGVISGGMIPKLEACVDCVKNGVEKAHIIDGRVEHSLLLELFTSQGIGTQIYDDTH